MTSSNSRIRCDLNFSSSSSNPPAWYQSVRLLSCGRRCPKEGSQGWSASAASAQPLDLLRRRKRALQERQNLDHYSPCSITPGPLSPFQGSLRPSPIQWFRTRYACAPPLATFFRHLRCDRAPRNADAIKRAPTQLRIKANHRRVRSKRLGCWVALPIRKQQHHSVSFWTPQN
jgi:hypothetical protein